MRNAVMYPWSMLHCLLRTNGVIVAKGPQAGSPTQYLHLLCQTPSVECCSCQSCCVAPLAHCVGVLRAKAVQVGELEEALDAIKWGTDYLLNAHVEPKKFVAMYGSSEVRPASHHESLGYQSLGCEVNVPSGALHCLHTALWPFCRHTPQRLAAGVAV